MKKLFIWTICLLLMTTPSWCNSGPIHIEGTTGSEVYLFDQAPIGIEQENLTFTILDDASDASKISVQYHMKAETALNQNTRMLFPFQTSNLNAVDTVSLKINGEISPYAITLGSLSDDFLAFKPFKLEENRMDFKVYQYDFPRASTSQTRYYRYNPDAPMVSSDWFRSYGCDDNRAEITFSEDTPTTIYSIGAPIQWEIKTDSYQEKTISFDQFIDQIHTTRTASIVNFDAYVYQSLFDAPGELHFVSQFHSIYDRNLWVGLLYEAPITNDTLTRIDIEYTIDASMDRERSYHPQYQYDYLLAPAKNWSYFKELNLQIIPSESYPFVINSSVPLEKNKDGYVFQTNEIPDDWLTFTLYDKEHISWVESLFAPFSRNAGYYLLLLIPIGLLVLPLLVGTALYRFMRKKH